MKRTKALLLAVFVAGTIAAIAAQVFTFRCLRDGTLQQNTTGLAPRCSQCGATMIRVP